MNKELGHEFVMLYTYNPAAQLAPRIVCESAS